MQDFIPKPEPRRILKDELTAEKLADSTGSWPDDLLMAASEQLRRGRKVLPVDQEAAPSGATYDDLAGITYAPLDVTACGFRIKATVRRIGTTEVATYANKSCKKCHGLGKWGISRTSPVGRDDVGRKILNSYEYIQACPCAERRYKDAHRNFLINPQGSGSSEWIALDDLTVEKVMEVQVSGIDAGAAPPELDENDPSTRVGIVHGDG